MKNIILHEHNQTFCKVITDRDIELELQDYFSFFVQNYKHHPKYISGQWSGKINLLNRTKKTIYKGLFKKIEEFCIEHDYEYDDQLSNPIYSLSKDELKDHMNKISKTFIPRDYQLEAIAHCIKNNRATLLSPTASGKSFIIYSTIRWHDKRTLLIVPTKQLVNQMYSDFESYAKDTDWIVEDNVSKIMGGYSKVNLNQITISTWQSLNTELPEDFLDQFECVIVDEAHTCRASVLKNVIEQMKDCKLRYGFTGTLDGTEISELVAIGLFGPIMKVIRTHELIEQGHTADINIKCMQLQYSKISKKPKRTYQEEIDFLVTHKKRTEFIVKLSLALKGNTLVLFRLVEKQGDVLFELSEKHKQDDQNVYFISGKTDVDIREDIREQMNTREKRNILYASEGTTSTGISINNIDNIIFAYPSKARIKVLQSIGRGLRKSDTKQMMNLFDISDDLSKKKPNYTMLHFIERLKIYISEKFKYTITKIKLEEDK